MNRTLDETAALLNLKPRAFRAKLRDLRILTKDGDLASHHRDRGYLYSDTRSVWNKRLKSYRHYAVVMVKEDGVQWLAKKLDITVTNMNKDAAA